MVAIGAPQEKIFLIASFFKIFNEKKVFLAATRVFEYYCRISIKYLASAVPSADERQGRGEKFLKIDDFLGKFSMFTNAGHCRWMFMLCYLMLFW